MMIEMFSYRSIAYCVLYLALVVLSCQGFPSSSDVQAVSNSTKQLSAVAEKRSSVGEARQATLLAALGAALAPFLLGIFTPFLSQLASMVSTAVLGKLQDEPIENVTSSSHYDGYMINVADQPGPYLFLTTSNRDSEKTNKNKLVRKTPKISQHLGTVNIRPNPAETKNDRRHYSREMKTLTSSEEDVKE